MIVNKIMEKLRDLIVKGIKKGWWKRGKRTSRKEQ